MRRRVIGTRAARLAFMILAACVALSVQLSGQERALTVPGPSERHAYVPKPRSHASDRGRALYSRLDCAACHSISNHGGRSAPPLDGVGGRRSERVLVGQLGDPSLFAQEHPELHGWEPSWMPHPHLTPAEVRLLVAYLLTLPEPPGGFAVGSHGSQRDEPDTATGLVHFPGPSEASARGERLYYASGCASCHAIGRFGGEFAPRLDGIGGRHSRAFVTAHVSNPALHALAERGDYPHGSLMPDTSLAESEISDVVDFLLTIPDLGEGPDAP